MFDNGNLANGKKIVVQSENTCGGWTGDARPTHPRQQCSEAGCIATWEESKRGGHVESLTVSDIWPPPHLHHGTSDLTEARVILLVAGLPKLEGGSTRSPGARSPTWNI